VDKMRLVAQWAQTFKLISIRERGVANGSTFFISLREQIVDSKFPDSFTFAPRAKSRFFYIRTFVKFETCQETIQ
jgi:hypothetical protein